MDNKISGQTIDQIEQSMFSAIAKQDQLNLQTFRNFHKSGNQTALANAMKPENFGANPSNSFWKY
jgi:hypothetical protein